ncbi:MAG: hypothetical protein RBS01_03435 [Candidatus Dojkabacteria bacterium]|jgi:NADH:ubiquinone oxidoreductase subunit 5 (subunit L)/multisubunit Na+/H+ antiporter MnhA subunit|nr:hypothetical protein [Candidatus Dojkabacteria bacterium]
MEIPLITAIYAQLIVNTLLIISLIYLLYLILRLIFKVVKGKEVEKRKEIKKIILLTIIVIGIFSLTNVFFEYDPFNIIEDAKYIPLDK